MKKGTLALSITGSLLVLSCTLFGWVNSEADGLREIRNKLLKKREQWQDLVAKRPPAWGKGNPGNAWNDYRRFYQQNREKICYMPKRGEAVPLPPTNLINLSDSIHAGAGRTLARIAGPADLQVALSGYMATNVTHGAIWFCRLHLENGQPEKAVDRCIDALWYGGDVIRVGRNWGDFILLRILQPLASCLVKARGAAGKRMLPPLKRFHDSLPSIRGSLLTMEICLTKNALATEPPPSGFLHRAPGIQKQLAWWINRPINILDMGQTIADQGRQRNLIGAPWRDISPKLARSSPGHSWSEFFGIPEMGRQGGRQLIQDYRRNLALIRLLLAAATDGRELYPDPFGDGKAPVRSRREAGRVVFWSRGPDGVDDGGPISERVGITWFVKGGRAPDLTLSLPAPN